MKLSRIHIVRGALHYRSDHPKYRVIYRRFAKQSTPPPKALGPDLSAIRHLGLSSVPAPNRPKVATERSIGHRKPFRRNTECNPFLERQHKPTSRFPKRRYSPMAELVTSVGLIGVVILFGSYVAVSAL